MAGKMCFVQVNRTSKAQPRRAAIVQAWSTPETAATLGGLERSPNPDHASSSWGAARRSGNPANC